MVGHSQVERLKPEDALALQALAEAVGWRFHPEQAHLLLSAGGTVFGQRVQGRLIASAGIYTYDTSFSSLGVVMVDRAFQRRGLGRRMVERCLTEVAKTDTKVTLVATSEGFPLYASLGFQTVGQVYRYQRDSADSDDALQHYAGMSKMTRADLAEVIRMDDVAFGAPRSALLHTLFSQMQDGYVVRDATGALQGMGIAVCRGACLLIGPLVAKTNTTALALVQRMAAAFDGPVRLDVPSHQIAFANQLASHGFQEQRVSPVMLLGGSKLPGQRDVMFAIADPAFG
ncbi:GNAT family N-acetyltransferase [Alicyclobacillus suci]|uniref:GNAT family N-acetyltransferase n=1 Tax=Alicyclobacillus suci TaxID=2816080 RepID=UPI001A8D6272|nr:GNAT family N-acetyltransferase [Alicyclobacillus suci]